ncbi:hypothetical protein [Burkholderia anthina]|nr:hypothetical protein [Burkholderia anthina]
MDMTSLLVGFLAGVAFATLCAICFDQFRAAIDELERNDHRYHD